MNPLSAVYGRLAILRRRWYAGHPGRRRRLGCAVVSVGNLVVGGSGKTPVTLALAELLCRHGQRPAVLSRGYGRRGRVDAVVVVSDGSRVLEPPERSGDEPQMLARALPGVPVLVARKRYLAGRLAERRFGSTVLLLDDGFQHLELARDVDLLVVSPDDLRERVLPSGLLREPLSAARAADALLVPGAEADARRTSKELNVAPVFTVAARYEMPVLVTSGEPVDAAVRGPVVAVAGIARPGRFFDALRRQGWEVAIELPFRDHHWYTDRDLSRIAEAARDVRARLVMTTEKDAVRLEGRTLAVPWAVLPMRVSIDPADEFGSWLMARLTSGRA